MATFTVTNTNNDGAGSLRQALLDARNAAGDDTIVFDTDLAGQTITLQTVLSISGTGGGVVIDGDVDGDGNSDITISGDANGNGVRDEGDTRHLSNSNSDATVRNLTFTEGFSSGLVGTGGAQGFANSSISNFGNMTLENIVIEDTQALARDNDLPGNISGGVHAATIVNLFGELVIDGILFDNVVSNGGDTTAAPTVREGGNAVVGILQASSNADLELLGAFGIQNSTVRGGDRGSAGFNDGDAIFGVIGFDPPEITGGAVLGLLNNTTIVNPSGGGGATGSGAFASDDPLSAQNPVAGVLEDATLLDGLGTEADPLRTTVGTAFVAFRGDHVIRGQAASDTVFAGDGSDTVLGDGGEDTVFGEGGDDVITGGGELDALFGGLGDDTFLIMTDDVPDDTDGGGGVDTVDYSGADAGFAFEANLGTGAQARQQDGVGSSALGSLTDIENLIGSGGGDALTGGDGRNMLMGMGGNDRVSGGGSNDQVYGGDGNDTINGGDGKDTVSGGNNNDRLFGDAGNDRVIGGNGKDTARGGANNDQVFGGSGNDNLFGDAGNDRLQGGNNNDLLRGGSGNDQLFGQKSNDRLFGDKGNDTLDGSSGRDNLNGGKNNDVINGGTGNDMLTGGSGRDQFRFDRGDGSDTITDFRQGQDTIFFAKGGANRFEQLTIVDRGADVLIRYDGGSIRVKTDDADNFTARDFDF